MPLIFIGNCGNKKVFVTPYSQKRFDQRNLSFKEALQVLESVTSLILRMKMGDRRLNPRSVAVKAPF